MNRVLQIFKKDAAHLWPQILVFLAALALFACNDPVNPNQVHLPLRPLLSLLLPLSCWLLVTLLILEEKAVGHEQYWLTRPFTRTDLLAAKALFLLVFVLLPVLICQLLVLAANGFPPMEYLPGLLIKQLFFAAWLLLPMAAIAAATRNLGHAFLGGLLLAAGVGILLGLMAFLLPGTGWGELFWIRASLVAVFALGGAATVIYLQYTRRRAALGRSVLAGVALLAVLIFALPPWQPAFALQSRLSKQQFDPQAVRISFDPRPDPRPAAFHNAHSGDVYLVIPIRVDNVPPGLRAVSDWTSVEAPWRAGPSADWGISEGRWLTVKAGAFRDDVVRLRGLVDLTLGQPDTNAGCRISTGYSPYPTSPWFDAGIHCDYVAPTAIVVLRPLAHITRSFDLGPLRLSDYRVTVE